MKQVFTRVPRDVLYARTGIQFLPINTLYQLYAHERMQSGELVHAYRLLMIPDLLHSWLCGSLTTEQTNASTTQCWDPIARAWATDLLNQLAIRTTMLPPVVEAGTVLGRVLLELRDDLGEAQVVAPATHDTGSAIVATPAQRASGWGYISSGTWSLVGLELSRPVMTPEALAANCTNEGGVFGTTRFLKNVMGLWLLQECQRRWARDGHARDYDTLLADVDSVPPFAALIEPDDARFLTPEDMPAAINAYLQEHGQMPLSAPAAFVRCIKETIASSLIFSGELVLTEGDASAARSLAEEALALFRQLGLPWGFVESLRLLARVEARQSNHAVARALYEECLAVARESNHKPQVASSLEGLAGLIAAQGDPGWAARLWGAAESLREAIGMPRPPVYRADYERSVASARTRLGERIFAAAWAEGRMMTPEQALAAERRVMKPSSGEPSSAPPAKSPLTYPDGLTAREVEVLRLVAMGLTNGQAAEQLVISPRTVNTHLTAIYGKIAVSSRGAATRYAIEHHLI